MQRSLDDEFFENSRFIIWRDYQFIVFNSIRFIFFMFGIFYRIFIVFFRLFTIMFKRVIFLP